MDHVITQISQAKRNSERVNIYLNGRFWIGLGKNDLISLKLVNGKVLSELEKQEIEKISISGKIMDSAINYIQIRPRSCAEVRDYLVYKKGLTEEEAENVVTNLEDRGLLSDEKFAQWYADYKLSTGVNGVNKIKAELLGKKVNLKIINQVLEKFNENDEFKNDQQEKIKEFIEKVSKTIKAKDAYDLKSKLIQRLMARGFKYEDIKKALAQ